ncbi:hypothetical protein C8J25_105211 [Sphingomonas faeni]|uniref:Uncharacterized protein n=1 Tax=Sphingomonas faeni TaxID=185950 RepID=A0A2T5U4P5_9SPHN|nr:MULTISPECIES: hypothetical protein [Sphingomonas]PTW46430.1 hypothetical protein C8J25_105211 [Sphingomonas faeni]RKE45731.1 hypothetical protein C8J39_2868 [Sphingomonas sp. PP-CC-1A-547]TCM06680.1 hypothetical protein C8J41_104102 [Sphingomonas sp. PP-CC-3G-468]
MPLFSTPTQFAALALIFVAGWLFGLASHPGGKKWKARYHAERDAHAVAKKDADIRAAAAEKRAVEAEHENARLVKATPVAPVAPVTTTRAPVEDRSIFVSPDTRPVAASSARPAYNNDGTKRGWFDFDRR